MNYRKHTYDNLEPTLKGLAATIIKGDDILLKGKEEGGLSGSTLDNFKEATLESLETGEQVFKAFSDLKQDFEKGNINMAFYIDHLKRFKEMLIDTNLRNFVVPHTLKAEEIRREVKKYIA